MAITPASVKNVLPAGVPFVLQADATGPLPNPISRATAQTVLARNRALGRNGGSKIWTFSL
jgi:hypothetical protein